MNFVLTVLVHVDLDAFLESTRPTLVPMGLVDRAGPAAAVLAGVGAVPPDRALEETAAAIAGVDAVVFARTTVTADFARDVQETVACEIRDRQKTELKNRQMISGKNDRSCRWN